MSRAESDLTSDKSPWDGDETETKQIKSDIQTKDKGQRDNHNSCLRHWKHKKGTKLNKTSSFHAWLING